MLKILIQIVLHICVHVQLIKRNTILVPILLNILVSASHVSVDVHISLLTLSTVLILFFSTGYVLSRGEARQRLEEFLTKSDGYPKRNSRRLDVLRFSLSLSPS